MNQASKHDAIETRAHNLEIEFPDEQAMLMEFAQGFCQQYSSPQQVRDLLGSDAGYCPTQWAELAKLGWTGINIPEPFNGSGLTVAELVPVVEAMGQHLMSVPLVPSVLASQVLADSTGEPLKNQWLPQLASGSAIASVALSEDHGSWDLLDLSAELIPQGDTLLLTGEKTFVEFADSADVVLVSAKLNNQPTIVLLERAQLADRLRRETVIDETRRSFCLNLNDLSVDPGAILQFESVENSLATLRRSALLLTIAEITGGILGVMKVVIDYLNTRSQFGKLIGSYQALKHPMANLLCDYNYCRSLLYHAATVFRTPAKAEDIDIALHLAKAHSGETFLHAGDRAVQFHGGFGFTYDCDAQLYLRRAIWCQTAFGDALHHRQQAGELLLGDTTRL